jgi:hypothetical protein
MTWDPEKDDRMDRLVEMVEKALDHLTANRIPDLVMPPFPPEPVVPPFILEVVLATAARIYPHVTVDGVEKAESITEVNIMRAVQAAKLAATMHGHVKEALRAQAEAEVKTP